MRRALLAMCAALLVAGKTRGESPAVDWSTGSRYNVSSYSTVIGAWSENFSFL